MQKLQVFGTLLFLTSFISIKAQQDNLKVTYINNSGFLLENSNEKILIDGIYSDGYGIFTVPSAATITKEKNAESPFDSIKLLVITHYHADHINPANVTEHLFNDNSAILLSTNQVKSLMEEQTNYTAIQNKINSILPQTGVKVDTIVNNISLKVMFLKHNNDQNSQHENLGFIINKGKFKLFFTGDGQGINPEEYKALKLNEDSIDIAFLPNWFFDSDQKGKDIIEYLNPKLIVITHIRINQTNTYKTKVQNMSGIPPVQFFESSMQEFNFVKRNNVVSILTSLRDKHDIRYDFLLNQNYPNPFNPETNFDFRLSDFGFTTFTIYDALGKEVTTLLSGLTNPGEYHLSFNSNHLASGIYFYVLNCNGKSVTKKMNVLK